MKVYYGMNFWGSFNQAARESGKESSGKERNTKNLEELVKIPLDQEFQWGDISGFIPAIYVGVEGMAVDVCVRVSNEAFQAFYDKWQPKMENELSLAEQEQAEAENPMHINFHLGVAVNGKRMESDFACGTCYSKIAETEYKKDGVEEQLVQEYHCDYQSSWCFKRYMFKWEERPEKILNLELNFIACQKDYFSEQIEIDMKCRGNQYDIVHPLSGKRYKLCLRNMIQQEISQEALEDFKGRGRKRDWEYPNQYLILAYTMEPEISSENFRLQDAIGGDSPRNMQANESGAVSVIGAADGPTSIFIAGKRKEKQEMFAISAMYFEPVESMSLRPIFMEKEREDMRLYIEMKEVSSDFGR